MEKVGLALEIVRGCKYTVLHPVYKEFFTPVVSLLIALARILYNDVSLQHKTKNHWNQTVGENLGNQTPRSSSMK
jgi:hypothetical protein